MRCVFCNATENLNSSINIKHEDETVTVYICEAHEEEASMKAVREAYAKKRERIGELIKELEELGYKINKAPEATKTQNDPKQKAPQPVSQPSSKLRDWAQSGSATAQEVQPKIAVDGKAQEHANVQEPHKLPPLQREVVRSEDGAVKIEDETGKTNIRIIPGADGGELVNRVKAHADDPNKLLYKSNTECTACQGSGIAFNGKICPKCKGKGTFMR
jgi:hypothetical protein